MYPVLCTRFYVPGTMYPVLCTRYYVPGSMYPVTTNQLLRTSYYVLGTTNQLLCTRYGVLGTRFQVLCTSFREQYKYQACEIRLLVPCLYSRVTTIDNYNIEISYPIAKLAGVYHANIHARTSEVSSLNPRLSRL